MYIIVCEAYELKLIFVPLANNTELAVKIEVLRHKEERSMRMGLNSKWRWFVANYSIEMMTCLSTVVYMSNLISLVAE